MTSRCFFQCLSSANRHRWPGINARFKCFHVTNVSSVNDVTHCRGGLALGRFPYGHYEVPLRSASHLLPSAFPRSSEADNLAQAEVSAGYLTDMLHDGLPRHDALADEDIHQTLQRLHVLPRQKIIVHCDCDEVHKTRIEFEVAVDVPKGVVPVVVVEMGVAAEHLLDDGLHVGVVGGREAGGAAEVLGGRVGAGEGGEGVLEIGGLEGNGTIGGGGGGRGVWVRVAGDEGRAGDLRRRVGGEDVRVVDFAHDPFLHAGDVGWGGDFGWTAVFEPGVCQSVGGVRLFDREVNLEGVRR